MSQSRIPVNERRQSLIEAAVRVLSRDGVAPATTRAICAEAGMPSGFFHYCFSSKSELMLEVLNVLEQHLGRMAVTMAGSQAPLGEVLKQGFEAYLGDLRENAGLHQLTYELALNQLRDPDLHQLALRQYAGYEKMTAEFLRSAATSAQCEWTHPVSFLARYVASVLDGATLEWLVNRDDEQTRGSFEALSEYLVGCAA